MLGIVNLNHAGNITLLSGYQVMVCTGGPQIYSMNFVPPGNRTIAKIVLNGDCFSTKIVI